MNFSLPKLRFWYNRNPSSTVALQNGIPGGIVHGGDDKMTAETSSACNVRGGDDDKKNSTDGVRNPNIPPVDDCCPICFSEFAAPCRASCGHWYCGGCVLKYWNYSSPLGPCCCPMCSLKITCLTPEASLLRQQQEADVTEVLEEVHQYNRLFAGGFRSLFRRVAQSPLVLLRRVGWFMLNPDRILFRISLIRAIAILIGSLDSIIPFLLVGRKNAINIFEFYAVVLCLILYWAGLYLRGRRLQRARGRRLQRARGEMPAIEL